jgi:LmbE family N-acetylglucosaminyl deacetylase
VVERTTSAVFLAPHYDDVALSCGGTVARLADSGEAPVIITVFGGKPDGPLTQFASDMHQRWGVGPNDAIALRRAEEQCAERVLGARSIWLDFADAIYRDGRYTSDLQLFGAIHPREAEFAMDIHEAMFDTLDAAGIAPSSFYVPLAIGNHVDHQHVLTAGLKLAQSGYEVSAYEDFPYAGDPAWRDTIEARALNVTSNQIGLNRLTPSQLDRRVEAVLCYRSQLDVIFRRQGDPATATRRYARVVGNGEPAERFWRL